MTKRAHLLPVAGSKQMIDLGIMFKTTTILDSIKALLREKRVNST